MRVYAFQVFGQDEFGPATLQDVIDLIERVTHQVKTEPARFDRIVGASFHFGHRRLFPVIAQPHAYATLQSLHGQHDELIVAQFVGVADNVRARLIDAQDHQRSFALRKRIGIEKFAHLITHQRQIARMAAEFDFRLLHRVR